MMLNSKVEENLQCKVVVKEAKRWGGRASEKKKNWRKGRQFRCVCVCVCNLVTVNADTFYALHHM